MAHIYDGAKQIQTIDMFDDGKQGHDSDAGDGVYSGILDIKPIKSSDTDTQKSKSPKKVRIDVQYSVTPTTVPAPNAHYETGTDLAALVEDYRKLGVTQLTAYSTETTHVSPDEPPAPSMQVISPRKTARVEPGSEGVIRVSVRDARPILDQVLVSLGQGIEAKATSVRSEDDDKGLATSIELTYKVRQDAKPGTRNLSLQFGDVRLTQQKMIHVDGKDKGKTNAHETEAEAETLP
ncbi:hypothetical protein SAMN04244572_03989 [Azotobacter beijerinckii]|uniref:Uncharacterized protein n=1 Tax=Azotobacter beijerinckii TaxID=170623 RepID=A0A1H6YS80_9GAMM|nr:hypothetical protein [Azotobacter beijerinckii]SEJ44153.1 hypothetical protein SAMN04244572_03989 [Azotobacter beijerinckii]